MVTGRNDQPQRPANKAKAGMPSRALDSLSHAPRLLSVKDGAMYLGVSVWTMRSLGWTGEVPEVKIGRRTLFDLKDLDQFVERSKRRNGV